MSSSSSYSYLSLFFSPTPAMGMDRIAAAVVDNLDYSSVVSLKRSCTMMRNFVDAAMADERAKWRKLEVDWREAQPKVTTIKVALEVRLAKFYDGCRKILVSSGCDLFAFNVSKPDEIEVVFRGHEEEVSAFDLDKKSGRLISCTFRGKMFVWDLSSGEILLKKQLYGRIEKVVWRGRYVATAHTGLAFDAGCVNIREFSDESHMPVVFNKMEDRLLAVDLDFNSFHLVVLEWAGTWGGVQSGHVNVFRFLEDKFVVDLRDFVTGVTYSAVKINEEDIMVTVGHDRTIRGWQLRDSTSHPVDLIFELSTLHRSIIVGLDLTLNRMMTRDAEGVVFIWDLSSAVEEGAKAHNAGNREEIERRLVLREIKKTSRAYPVRLPGLALSDRHWAVSDTDGTVTIADVWS